MFVSGPRANLAPGPVESLRRQDYYAISKTLVASGFSESRAMSLARGCCGSSSILKRLVTEHPDTVFPPWCHDDIRVRLAPFALVGGWKHVDPPSPGSTVPLFGSPPPMDMWAVTELTGCTREELERQVARWETGTEPLFVRFGNSVLVASREDAWHLLGSAISADQIKRFQDLSQLVLEEDNPAFQLATDQRWMASIYGKVHSLSEDLRRSIVETLALMATYPMADTTARNVDLKGTVRAVLERVLPAGATWQRWASLGHNLPIVAEADPELFLVRVEADLRSDDPELPKLFQDRGHGIFGGGAIHSDLLWALEGLAWAPEYLTRVAVCLAKLASRDPGGTYANRPANSFRGIFLWWYWQTNASLEQRIGAISAVLNADPLTGWKLLKTLLPSGTSSVSHNTHTPRWRPWADGWSREKLRPTMGEYAIAIANLTIETADTDPKRWSEILDGILRFSPEITEKVFAVLERVCESAASSNSEAAFALWNEVRMLASRHERYSEAGWAFEKSIRDRLVSLRDRLLPMDVVFRNFWLFDRHAEIPGFHRAKDYVAHEQALHEARMNAIREIVEREGAPGVTRLLDLGADAGTVGWLVGQQRLLSPQEMSVPTALDSSDSRRSALANAYVGSRFFSDRWAFVRQLPIAQWSVVQIASFARCLPFNSEVWEWLPQYGPDVVREYWQRINGFLRDPTLDILRRATTSFISVGRRRFGNRASTDCGGVQPTRSAE